MKIFYKIRDNSTACAMLVAITIMLIRCVIPDLAFASDASDFRLNSVLSMIQNIVTVVLLPIGIIVAAWNVIYIAIFCGIMGIDPMDKADSFRPNAMNDPWGAVKTAFKGCARGLFWVCGIWILFTLVIQIVSLIVGTIANSGMF